MGLFGKLVSGSLKVSKVVASGSAKVVRDNVPNPLRDDGKPDRRRTKVFGMTKAQRDYQERRWGK